jgi:MmyB-like transcription regulator ligand binding domain
MPVRGARGARVERSRAAPMLTKTFRHPVVGEITVDCDTLTLTDRDQHLVLYSALVS